MEMQSPKIVVDFLDLDDVDWFVEVAAINMIVEELKRPELIHKETLFTLAFKGCMEKTAFVAKVDGVCVGALGAILVPNMLNPNVKTLAEVFWYVLPEYRKSKAGAMLLGSLEATGMLLAEDTTLSLLPSSEVGDALTKRGFVLEEFGYRKRNK